MRKRLIEKFTKAKEGSFGYTMTELLVVVAIIAIVAAIAIPSVIAISRALKFKRVNDHAKSIFLAAQQNLTEMRSDGGLKPLQEAGGSVLTNIAGFPEEFKTEYVYTTQGTTAFELILPVGSVDGTVRAEDIVIEYNPITGNVYAVFYCEDDDQNIMSAYADTGLPREDKSARKDMMLGYYDGSGLNSSQLELEKTQASVEFVNGEEGIVRVLVPVPDDFFSSVDKYAQALEINLTVTGEYSMVKAAENPPAQGETAPAISFSLPIKDTSSGLGANCYVEYGNTVVVEYPIDSLVNMGSFANYASGTQKGAKNASGGSAEAALTEQMDETGFSVLPGENITIQADVIVDTAVSEVQVKVDSGILSGVNPMFEYLQPSGSGGYVLAVSNGRNLQNLNAIAPTIAKQVDSVVFTSDIYWNDTVSYYNDKYGNGSGTYTNAAAENPARALPYFVPIHNEGLFGTAKFIFPGEGDGGLSEIINAIIGKIEEIFFGGFYNAKVPTLTDELDAASGVKHADIQGNGHKVYNLNIDSTKYTVPNVGDKSSIKNPNTGEYVETDLTGKFYATGENQIIDYCFTGLFGYVNTPVDDLHVVNPIIKGHEFTKETTVVQNYLKLGDWMIPIGTSKVNLYNNPATGALIGVGGFNTLVTDCSTYIDKDARGYNPNYFYHGDYSKTAVQTWYGVSGEGAVGGLVGYAKSHRNVSGELTNDRAVLAFSKCFAAVPVSGNMRGTDAKDFGYSNGVGAFIGNSQITNFYNCYASGDVKATGSCVYQTDIGKLVPSGLEKILMNLFGPSGSATTFPYSGRTSMGAGGFVGSSHGTRYTNCFATGDVVATGDCAGGFVGFMSIDETFAYGNDTKVAQRTVFTNCYAVGYATNGNGRQENFSGGNGRVVFKLDTTMSYFVNDYYRLYAPYYARYGTEPKYGTNGAMYVFRDSYYRSDDPEKAMENTNECALPAAYEVLQNLIDSHSLDKNGNPSTWIQARIKAIKDIVLYENTERVENPDDKSWIRGDEYIYVTTKHTYDTEYFIPNDPTLYNLYVSEYLESYNSGNNGWEAATPATTHSYELETAGAVYPFSKLYGMDYYGNWPSEPAAAGLAYYESYVNDDNTYYYFDRKSTATTTDYPSNIVDMDGYAILSQKSDNISVTIGTKTQSLGAKEGGAETFEAGSSVYYIFHLNETLMDEAAKLCTNGSFYVPMTVSQAGDTYTMYFNPYVYLSQVNPVYGTKNAVQPDETDVPKTMYIRSARQFAGLSKLSNYWTANYSYIQQFSINANTYLWDDAAQDKKVASIGTSAKPFNASYRSANDNQFRIEGFQYSNAASGLFGVVGTTGKVENLVVACTSVDLDNANASDVAVVAAHNGGTISNVDMTITGNVVMTGKTNAGLLAGYSSGTIQNCDVVVAQTSASVNMTATNAGGLVGCIEGTEAKKAVVTNCTLNISPKLTITGTGNAGGLIGHASHLNLSATEPLVTMTELTAANAAYAGGLAGWMEDSEIKITDAASVTTVTFNTVSAAKGTAAGFLGGGKNVAANGVDVTAGTVSGNIAAGFLGTGTNVDAAYCDVVITNGIQGKAKAAGVAGTIGAQSVFEYVTVNLGTKVEATEGNAAGYAVELAAETDVMNGSVTLNNTTISAPKGKAAGYACSAAGYVGSSNGSSVPSSVVRKDGKNTISGANAAGFACEITGQVSGAFVTPALDSSKYLGNNNKNLVVNGTSSAAGFALSVGADATVTNCYALNKISGAAASGFIGTNKGTVTGCMANVTITGGSAFIATNEGTVTRCYGWYGDGDTKDATTTVATVGGKCFSAYFADLNPVDKEGDIVTLYATDGTMQTMSATALQGAAEILANASNKWYTTGYNSYPYTQKPSTMPNYLYPMLRDHFGDWITPPQYAYGVAYYETYEVEAAAAAETEGATTGAQTIVKLHMVDLSAASITEEGQSISTYLVDNAGTVTVTNENVFANDHAIASTGYAVFGKQGANVLASLSSSETPLFSYTLNNNINSKDITYDFFPMKADDSGAVTIGATAVSSTTATVHTWFADAINAGDTYQVRTPEQLAKIGGVSANYNQTHDIAVTDFTTATIASGKTYDGGNCTLSASAQTKTWLSEVSGTVKNLNLSIANGVNAPVFGKVSGSVTLSGLTVGTIGENGALAETVSGTMTIPTVEEIPAVDGKLFGDSDGTINTGAITVGTTDTDGKRIPGAVAQLFGDVANVTVNGAIETGTVSGKLFDDVSGTVSTKAISVTGAATQVFGNVSANAEKNNKVTVDGAINVTGAATQVFGTVGAPVEVKGAISTGTVNTQVFGAVNANVTTGAVTVNGTAAQVFGEVGNGTVTVNGDISVDKTTAHTGKIFNDVKNTVNVTGKISLGEIGGNGQVFGAVTAPVTVSGGITSSNGTAEAPAYGAVNGQIFGAITLDATETVNIGGITVGNIASGKSLITSISGGTVSTGAVTVKNVSGQVFGPISGGTVTVGAVSTQAVGSSVTEGEGESAKTTVTNANIFGDVSANTDKTNSVTVASITTNGKDVYGNVFGNIGAPVTVTNGITTGNLTGKVFGNVSADVTTESITAGAVTGDIFGDITGGTVTTGAIQVASLSGKLAGTVGGTLQGNASEAKSISLGTDVTLGNLVTKVGSNGVLKNYSISSITHMSAPLVGGELGGTLDNVDVTAGSATVESGVLVNSVASGATVKNCAVTITGKVEATGTTVGGLTGSNAGTLSGNTVNIGTLTATGTNATVGGLVGINSGSISGAEVSATINHTGNGGVTIGGIVGEMTGGSLTNSKASGSINAPENLTNKANAIGGAIGKISAGAVGEDNKTTPTVVTTSVTVDAKWAGSAVTVEGVQFQNTGNGSVGTFVGSIVNGAFTNCSSTAKSSYQFMGQIAVKSNTLDSKKSIWFSNTKADAETSVKVDFTEGQTVGDYSSKGYTRLNGGHTYNTYEATLSNCTFVYSDENTYKQEIGAVEYFYLGTEKKTDKYMTSRVNSVVTYTAASEVSYMSFGYYNDRGNNTNVETDYYVDVDGVKYQVYATITRDGNDWRDPVKYVLSYGNDKIQFNDSGWLEDSWRTTYSGEMTLYTKNFTFPNSTEPQMYMIVNSGYAMDANGQRQVFKAEFEKTADDANLYNAIWQSTGSGTAWTNLSNNRRYINVTRNGTVGAQANTTVSYVADDNNGNSKFSMNNGNYYLRYRNNAFGTGDYNSNYSQFEIYRVSHIATNWEATFTPQNGLYSEQILPVLPAATALSEETEIPADNGGETGNNT